MLPAAPGSVCAVAHERPGAARGRSPNRPPRPGRRALPRRAEAAGALGTLADRQGAAGQIESAADCEAGKSLADREAILHTYNTEPNMGVNKDQVKGRVSEAKGRIKEVTGRIIGDKDLAVKGEAQKLVGAVLAKVGDAEEAVKKSRKDS
jgi:uncharacterized protein YjbJ (UPF0337 family)